MKKRNTKKNNNNRNRRTNFDSPSVSSVPEKNLAEKKTVYIPEVISVIDFAGRANISVTQVISELIKNGVLATINETIDFETASIIGDDLNVEVLPEEAKEDRAQKKEKAVQEKKLIPRPPVVTIMGHVDHGKTTLLDNIRKEHVAESESGGITQHISAYQVTLGTTKNKNIKNRTITFIDTPGHAAFSAMREHGAAITDIVVLIVAANDGVMPQTLEVIEQAKGNNVPVIVAINKIDLPDSDLMRIKQQLSEHDLVPEEWGGKTVVVEISAKTGKGVDDLLEMILLQADMMELKAIDEICATGVVIESKMTKGMGATAMVLVENGILKKGDAISIGSSYGRARILEDFNGKPISKAGPSFPVRIAGLKSIPNFGDRLLAFSNEKEARENAEKYKQVGPRLNIATARKMGEAAEGEKVKGKTVLNLVIKCDVKGSLEAVRKLLSEIKEEDVAIKIISEGVGPVSESDVTLAKATGAIVVGFRVNILGAAKKIAEKDEVQVRNFNVIYELIDKIKEILSDLLPPEIIEQESGTGRILGIFRDDRKGFVAGGMVDSGSIKVGSDIKFIQGESEKYRSKVLSLRREKSEVKECESGSECGFGLPPFANVAVGDKFIVFNTIEKKRTVK